MEDDRRKEVNNHVPEARKLRPRVRYIERSSEELGITLYVTRDATVFDRTYTLRSQVGKGGFGKVFKAIHNETLERVVIKQVESERVPCWCRLDGEMVPMEVVLMKKLASVDGVSKMLEVYELHGTWNIVMVGGTPAVQDMFDYICKRGYLSECESAFVMYQLIGILMKCHEAGVIHRDLKDENVLINSDNHEIQLIDFGSGAFLHDGVYRDFDGTRVYSPPEWLRTTGYHGKPAEIWTVGILLFDMINGDIPFMSDHEILMGRVHFRRNLISTEAIDLVNSCCCLDPSRRPTLMQILLHPWMRIFRNTVARLECALSQHALDESAKYMPSPLATSITVRSGLCDLASICVAHSGVSLNNATLKGREGEQAPAAQQQGQEEQPQISESENLENGAAEGEHVATGSQESCQIPPHLLPIQSAESVSAQYNDLVHSGYLRRREPILFTNNTSSIVRGENDDSTFHRTPVHINPAASGSLHRFDARHPELDVHPFFRQTEGQRLDWDIARDFASNEGPLPPNWTNSNYSSGYFSRTSSTEEEQARNDPTHAALPAPGVVFEVPTLGRRPSPLSRRSSHEISPIRPSITDVDNYDEDEIHPTPMCLRITELVREVMAQSLGAQRSTHYRRCHRATTPVSSGSNGGSSGASGSGRSDGSANNNASSSRNENRKRFRTESRGSRSRKS